MTYFQLYCENKLIEFEYLPKFGLCYLRFQNDPSITFLHADGDLDYTVPAEYSLGNLVLFCPIGCNPDLVEDFLLEYSPKFSTYSEPKERWCCLQECTTPDNYSIAFFPRNAHALFYLREQPYYKNDLEQIFTAFCALKEYTVTDIWMEIILILLELILSEKNPANLPSRSYSKERNMIVPQIS